MHPRLVSGQIMRFLKSILLCVLIEELRAEAEMFTTNDTTLALHDGISRACMKKAFIREPGKKASKTAEIYSDDLVLFFSVVSKYLPFVDINVFL